MTIRRATPADARALAEVHVASWRAAYTGLVPDGYLARLSVDEREVMWEALLADPRNAVVVAGETSIDGFVAFEPATREIKALYVAPQRFRQGVGTRLLTAAHEALGDETALWVLEGNEPAFALYTRHGYARDGATTIHVPTGLTEVRMTRQIRE